MRSHRLVRLSRHLLLEAALLGFGVGFAASLELHRGPSLASAACVVLALLGAAAGVLVRHRSGELLMAWRCPRLDGLGLRTGSSEAPWAVLEAAERALEALAPAQRRFPGFFPNARAELIQAACRAVMAHRRVACARGEPGLEGRAAAELGRLATLLRDIRRRLVEASEAHSEAESPVLALEALQERCGALAEAVAETGTPGALAPTRVGVTV